jgi:hypothetical protein
VNQRFGNLTLGMRLGREAENEDRHSVDYFSLRHSQERWIGQLGAQVELMGVILAGAWDFERGAVKAKSIDPPRFHEDDFTWKRPLDRYTAALVWASGDRIEGGVRASVMDREGSEAVEVSWSEDAPLNPSNELFHAELTTFYEQESEVEILSRWRFGIGSGTFLGLEGSYRDFELDVDEGVNFKGSQRAGAWSQSVLGVGAGVSQSLMNGRILLVLEARGLRGDSKAAEEGILTEETWQDALLSAGLEYFPRADLALRCGVAARSFDGDVDGPTSLALLKGASGGVSWLPRGGTIQVHGALRYSRQEPWDTDAADLADEDDLTYLLGLRLLL